MKLRFLRNLVIVFAIVSLAGCLAIDYSTIQDKPFYKKTGQSLQRIGNRVSLPREPQPLLAGAARVEITPPLGVPLAGYGTRKGRARSVHYPLYTRALVVSSGPQRIIIVNSDLLAISNEIFETVLKKVNRKMPLSPDDLIITATHTHSGPGGLSKKFWETFATGPFDPTFFETLTSQMAEVILRAKMALKPARMRAASAEAPDLIKNRMIVGGARDAEIGIIEFQTLDNSQRTLIINFSAHPTILDSSNLSLSGDFPSAVEGNLEAQVGTIALYTAGAVGDQTADPPRIDGNGEDDSKFKQVEEMGKILSDRVLRAIADTPWSECGGVESIRITLNLPPSQVRLNSKMRLPSFFGNLFFDRTSTLQAIRINDQVLVGVPADLSSEIGHEVKEYARGLGLRALILGFSNDYVGYIIPEKYYRSRAYEASMSFNGPHMDQYFRETAFHLIDTLHVGAPQPCPPAGGKTEERHAGDLQKNSLIP